MSIFGTKKQFALVELGHGDFFWVYFSHAFKDLF